MTQFLRLDLVFLMHSSRKSFWELLKLKITPKDQARVKSGSLPSNRELLGWKKKKGCMNLHRRSILTEPPYKLSIVLIPSALLMVQ